MKIISVIVINYQNVELNTLYGSQNVIINHSNYPLDTSDVKIGFCSPPGNETCTDCAIGITIIERHPFFIYINKR